MLDALFFAFSHPDTVVGRDGGGDLLLADAGAVLITLMTSLHYVLAVRRPADLAVGATEQAG